MGHTKDSKFTSYDVFPKDTFYILGSSYYIIECSDVYFSYQLSVNVAQDDFTGMSWQHSYPRYCGFTFEQGRKKRHDICLYLCQCLQPAEQ